MTINSIFGVVKTYPSEIKLKAMFIDTDFTSAKLWFQGFISGDKEPHRWVLYKLGEIGNDLKLKSFKIYVCSGMNVYKNVETKYEQYKLFTERKREEERKKQEAELLKTMFKENRDFKDIVKEAFGGKIIENEISR